MVAQERKYAARVGLRLCRAMRARLQAYTYYYAIFNYCVGTSGVPASVLNIVGDQPLYTDPMPLSIHGTTLWPVLSMLHVHQALAPTGSLLEGQGA